MFKNITVFGYQITIPNDLMHSEYFSGLIKEDLPKHDSIKIIELLTSSAVPDMIHYIDRDDTIIVVGFKPPNDINVLPQYVKELDNYVNTNLSFVKLKETPEFYTGFDWGDEI